MPPDQITPPAESENIQAGGQNPTSENNSLPPNPPESFDDTQDLQPTEQAPINTAHSEPSVALPGAPEGSPSDFSMKSTEIAPSDSTPPPPEKTQENQASSDAPPSSKTSDGHSEASAEKQNEAPIEAVSEQNPAPAESVTAQMAGNEPLTSRSLIATFLAKAKLTIQNRKRKKLDRIMTLFAKQTSVANDDVEKLLHVSDATATRYLQILVKEGKIKKEESKGKTGKWVWYSKI